jgi:hypothetical protein
MERLESRYPTNEQIEEMFMAWKQGRKGGYRRGPAEASAGEGGKRSDRQLTFLRSRGPNSIENELR